MGKKIYIGSSILCAALVVIGAAMHKAGVPNAADTAMPIFVAAVISGAAAILGGIASMFERGTT